MNTTKPTAQPRTAHLQISFMENKSPRHGEDIMPFLAHTHQLRVSSFPGDGESTIPSFPGIDGAKQRV